MERHEIERVISYNEETGVFTWKEGGRYNRLAGKPAGSREPQGYIVITFGGDNKRRFKAHRLAWLLMTGKWPDHEVDHINGDRADNRWANLRSATDAQQARNRRRARNNTTGFKGVSLKSGRYIARITINDRTTHLGCFSTAEDAAAAYAKAAANLFTDYAPTEQNAA